jgi:predicted Zn-dependent peptidase
LEVFERRVRQLGEQGPAADELAAAKRSLTSSLPHRLETVQGVVGEFVEMAAYQLPIDDLATLPARVEALGADDVRAAVPAPGAMKAVVVGDVAALRGPLLALGWGPIEVHDDDGNLVRKIAP